MACCIFLALLDIFDPTGPALPTTRWFAPPAGVEGREAFGDMIGVDSFPEGGSSEPFCLFTLCFRPGGNGGSSPKLPDAMSSSKKAAVSAG